MVTKVKKDDWRKSFRRSLLIDKIAQVTRDDKKYEYKGVITNYDYLPDNVTWHLDAGWEPIYSEEATEDQRSFVPSEGKDEKFRPGLVTKKTRDGKQYVFMRIDKKVRDQHIKDMAKRDEEVYLASIRRRNAKIKQSKGGVEITDSELNSSNFSPTPDEKLIR